MRDSGRDFFVTDRRGVTRALIQAKNRKGTSRDWAVELRKNLLSGEVVQAADYFAIVTPEALYVWRETAAGVEDLREYPIREALEKYLKGTDLDVGRISGSSFELIVHAWLADLVRGEGVEGLPADFRAALQDGRLHSASEFLA